ncbi:membrane hypothetical protein [metagenome]|uniref:Uncharacterized protein n=1 Tax=metagenome TaxID=256318 RepID=A0A2P2C0T2_9ZZZZ
MPGGSADPYRSAMQSREGTWLAVGLAVILLAYGVLAIHSHRDDSLRTSLLWVSSLLGSALLVLAGVLLRPSQLHLGTALLIVGAVLAIIPTMWTLVLPPLELGVIVFALRDHQRAAELVR